MTVTLIILVIVLVGFVVFVAVSYKKTQNMPQTTNSPKIKILNNKNFKLQIRSGITLVDFWAPWCGPCKIMGPILNELAEAAEGEASIGKLNVDQNQQLARKYKVLNIPTLLMFHKGREINRYVGVKNKKFLLKEIRKAQEDLKISSV